MVEFLVTGQALGRRQREVNAKLDPIELDPFRSTNHTELHDCVVHHVVLIVQPPEMTNQSRVDRLQRLRLPNDYG